MFGRTVIAATAVGLLLLAIGCGGDDESARLSKAEYEQQVGELGETFGSSLEGVTESSSPEEVDEQLAAAQKAFDGLADRLAELSPPEEIEDAHGRLVEGLRELGDDLDEIGGEIRDALAEAQESNDPTALFALFGRLASLESIQKLEEVEEEFEAKGYELGLTEAGAGAVSGATTTTP